MDKLLEALRSLIGRELSAVSFVCDYVEFHFDGSVVRALSAPEAIMRDAVIDDTVVSWRDALCAFIGLAVVQIDGEDDKFIDIVFEKNSHVLRIPLNKESPYWPERMHFMQEGELAILMW